MTHHTYPHIHSEKDLRIINPGEIKTSMDFSSVIDKIMPQVHNGSGEPFIIFHDKDGDWHCGFTQNQYGETFDWVENVKEQDPLARTFKGSDFANGSFAYVHDKVLMARLRAEYSEIPYGKANLGEFQALLCFCEENIGDFSSDVTDYLMRYDRPLNTLYDMLPISLKSIDSDYDMDKTEEVFELIDRQFAEIRSGNNNEIKPVYSDKRNIDGYEEKTSIKICGSTICLMENPASDEPYLVAKIERDFLGTEQITSKESYDDYIQAIWGFDNNVMNFVEAVQHERKERRIADGVSLERMTAEHCVPGGLDADLTNKVIIIKSEVLAPEYRTADHQIKIAMCGFGCAPNSRGNAVFCKDLYSGKESRFERYDVLGVAEIERLPGWAKKRLADIQGKDISNEPPQKSKNAEKKPSLLGKLDDNKQKVERSKAERKDKPITKNSENWR